MSSVNIGHVFTLDGIDVQLVCESYHAIYPYEHTVVNYIAKPTPLAMQTPEYLEVRRLLNDDWVSDLTYSDNLVGSMWDAGLNDDQIVEALDCL